jgi:hypothetical protein
MSQVPTEGITLASIMSSKAFTLGVADKRAGRPPREIGAGVDNAQNYDCINASWNYERGRAWPQSRRLPCRCGSEAASILRRCAYSNESVCDRRQQRDIDLLGD